MSDEREPVQWVRVPAQGPIKPGDTDNGPEIFASIEHLLACPYDSAIGDHMMLLYTPYSPDANGLATFHPGDWLYFAWGDEAVVVPDHIHRALGTCMSWKPATPDQEV